MTFNNEASKRFKALVNLDDKNIEKLVTSLGEELDGFTARANVYEYASKNVGEAADEFALAIEAVMPLLLNDQYVMTSPVEVIRGVVNGLERTATKSLSWTATEKSLLKARLKRILSDSNVRLRARAWTLVLERPCVLLSARILTDLRPVFTSKNPASLEACTVIHTLVMEVREGAEPKTVHIALDTKDLTNLRTDIARAEQKEKILNALASRAGVLSLQIK